MSLIADATAATLVMALATFAHHTIPRRLAGMMRDPIPQDRL